VAYGAVDGAPVEHFFVLIAPPVEASNEYLPVLGRIAQLAKEPDVPARLTAAQTRAEFLAILAEKGV
jgi:mannitol/fructose-specific phosphotransferase system IIA component (Ntr-type)